ncbi:MAG: F0F1 ATP synthase subunit B [Bacteroidales bacterium]|nr:F0F1 ATP synthase subunit B [Bacteroidales bacterium]
MEQLLQILGKIGFDWRMSLFSLINFLVAFWILKKFAFGPLTRVILERQKKSEETLENFEKAKSEIAMAKQTAKEIVYEGRVTINYLMSEAQNEAKQTVEIAKEKTKEETKKIIEEAKKTIEAEKEKMKESLYQETANLVSMATEKIIKDKLKATDDINYVKNVVMELNK